MLNIGKAINSHGESIVFTVALPDSAPVYMSVQKTNYCNDMRTVVIVDAAKFLQLWQAEPNSICKELSHGNPEIWRNDRKYHHAETGFSRGEINPVPLAEVACATNSRQIVTYKFLRFGRCEHTENSAYSCFTNGVTRTIWLLSKGCKTFPVECNISSAKLLYEAASAPGSDLLTVDELYTRY